MKIESLHLGMKVRHPQYGIGEVRSIHPQTAEVAFSDLPRNVSPELSGLEPAEPQVALSSLEMPLNLLIEQVARAVGVQLLQDRDAAVVEQLAARYRTGKMVLHPSDPTLTTKEIPLDVLFHKIVMIRNNLRVLEQKINSHPGLSDAEKVEIQQYITKSYGSLTTFNVLFKNKEDQFAGASTG